LSKDQQQAFLTHSFSGNRQCSCCREMKGLIHSWGTGKAKTSSQAFLWWLNYSLGEGLLLPSLVLLRSSKSLLVVVGNVFKSPESLISLMMG